MRSTKGRDWSHAERQVYGGRINTYGHLEMPGEVGPIRGSAGEFLLGRFSLKTSKSQLVSGLWTGDGLTDLHPNYCFRAIVSCVI